MIQLHATYSKEEISAAFQQEYGAVTTFFSEIEENLFFAAPVDVWSPAENLTHLIQSCKPIIMALNMPKIMLRTSFGKPKRTSQSWATVKDNYVNKALAGGGVAGGPFLPKMTEASAMEREKILSRWQGQEAKLMNALSKWSDLNLDNYRLPHPLLGKLNVREMLFFTLYHNLHHVNDVQRLLNIEESRW